MKKDNITNLTKHHPLEEIWNLYPDILSNDVKSISNTSVPQIIGEIFSVGDFYYYVINVVNSRLTNHHENILRIHGLKKYPNNLSDIIKLIHPDDLEFVLEAEKMTLEKIKEIGFEHQLNLKCSYCFRMKTHDGHYEMFHHQSLHTMKDENGKLVQAVNIHTNIHHITQQNSNIVLVAGIGERTDYHQMHFRKMEKFDIPNLTKREFEILQLIGKGLTRTEISCSLNISKHTVHTHRKNIMSKMSATNTSQLVRHGIEYGYL